MVFPSLPVVVLCVLCHFGGRPRRGSCGGHLARGYSEHLPGVCWSLGTVYYSMHVVRLLGWVVYSLRLRFAAPYGHALVPVPVGERSVSRAGTSQTTGHRGIPRGLVLRASCVPSGALMWSAPPDLPAGRRSMFAVAACRQACSRRLLCPRVCMYSCPAVVCRCGDVRDVAVHGVLLLPRPS